MKKILKKGQSFHLAPAGNLISALNPLRPQMWAAGPDVQFNLLTMVVVMMMMVMVMMVMMMVVVIVVVMVVTMVITMLTCRLVLLDTSINYQFYHL